MAIEAGPEKYIVEEIHCKFLGKEADGRYACTVYERRFEMAPWCRRADEAAAQGHVAQDCPYAGEIPDFHGKRWASPVVRETLMPLVRKILVEDGLPLSESP